MERYNEQLEEFCKAHGVRGAENETQMKARMALEEKAREEDRSGIRRWKGTWVWTAVKPARMTFHYTRAFINKVRVNGVRGCFIKLKGKIEKRRNNQKAFNQKYIKSILPTDEERKKQENTKFDKNIKFSILVPLYNTPMDFLEQMIDSVVQQTYQNWELCLADGSDDKHSEVGEYCKNLAKNDTRIVYEQLDENKGISENTNYCIKMATGDYIGLFDHDDVLHPCALYENMKMICEKNADFLYSDEATFQNDDLREIITYHFKPDFAIDNLRANNYICHFTVFARELVEQVGGFREEYNGSQDHDIILRLTSAAKCICHIPKILYFWRSHAASTSQDIYSKTYAIEAGQKAVRNSIEENGMHCEVESSPAFPTLYKIKYEVVGEPKVSIVIPNKDHLQDLLLCVDSILKKTSYSNYEIVIVENNSTSKEIFEYYKLIEQHEKVRVLRWEKEFNYSAINNFAVKQTDGDYVLLLNNDTEVLCEEWIQEMLMYAQREDVGAVGAKLYYSNGTIQHAGIIMGIGQDGVAGHSHAGEWGSSVGYMGRLYYAQDVIAVTGACLMVSRSKYDEVGGLNEELAVAYNDVDFCLKLWKKGYLNVFTPWAYLYHHESVSRGYEVGKDKKDRFQREVSVMKDIWKEELEKGDPFYNPNVSLVKPWGFGAGIKHSYEE